MWAWVTSYVAPCTLALSAFTHVERHICFACARAQIACNPTFDSLASSVVVYTVKTCISMLADTYVFHVMQTVCDATCCNPVSTRVCVSSYMHTYVSIHVCHMLLACVFHVLVQRLNVMLHGDVASCCLNAAKQVCALFRCMLPVCKPCQLVKICALYAVLARMLRPRKRCKSQAATRTFG